MSATTTPANAAKSATPTPADNKTVNLSLPAHIHAFFTAQAEADDRTLSNLLVRKLKALHDQETAPVD